MELRSGIRPAGLLLLLGLAVTGPLSAQQVSDCPDPASFPGIDQLVVDGRVLCYGEPPDSLKRGWLLTDPDDMAFVDNAPPFRLFAVEFAGGLEISAASEGGTPEFDKFYIVSETVGNLPPPLRAPFETTEIFGPFSYGTIEAPAVHRLDESTMASILALQSASPNNLMVVLDEEPGRDIFGPGLESFAGIRFTEATPTLALINEVCPDPLAKGTSETSIELFFAPPGSMLDGYQLLIYDSAGALDLSLDLSGLSSDADSLVNVPIGTPDTSRPFGIEILDPIGEPVDSAVLAPPGAGVDPALAALLGDPSEQPARLRVASATVWPYGDKAPRSNLGFYNAPETCGDPNRVYAINEIDITRPDGSQFVEIFTDQPDGQGLYLVSFDENEDDEPSLIFDAIDLATAGSITPPGYLVLDLTDFLPSERNRNYGVGLYELPSPPTGTIDDVRAAEYEFVDYTIADDGPDAVLSRFNNELGNGNVARDSLQYCPDASGLTFADLSQPFPPTKGAVNVCQPPSSDGRSSVANTPNAAAVGDPISSVSGEFFTVPETLLDLGGPLPLRFTHRYAAFLERDGRVQSALGANRMHDFELRFERLEANTIEVIFLGGQILRFVADAMLPGRWRLERPLAVPFQLYQPVGPDASIWLMDPRTSRVYEFDNQAAPGRLERITDRNGNALELTYPSPTSPVSEIGDGLGRSLQFGYTDGLLTSVSDGARTLQLAYELDVLAHLVDAAGGVHSFLYQTSPTLGPLLTEPQRPQGNTPFEQEFNTDGTVNRQLDAFGNVVSLAYDDPGRLVATDTVGVTAYQSDLVDDATTAVIGRAGDVLQFEFDPVGRIARIADRNVGDDRGFTDRSHHAPSGRLHRLVDAEGNALAFAFEHQSQTFGAGANLAHFDFHVVREIVHPDGGSTTVGRDERGNVTSITDPLGGITRYTRNAQGLPLTVMNPDGGVISATYAADGTLSTLSDADVAYAFSYDSLRRPEAIERVASVPGPSPGIAPRLVNGSGQRTTIGYDANDRIVALIDANGGVTTVTYDGNGNAISAVGRGEATSVSYDLMDRATALTNALGGTTARTFDALGRLASTTDPDGVGIDFGYDPSDNLTSMTIGSSTFLRGYDGEGIVTSTTSALGYTTLIESDRLGRPTAVTNPLAQRIEVTYEPRGYVRELRQADGSGLRLQTDENGLLAGASRFAADGTATLAASYAYSQGGDLEAIVDPTGEVWAFASTPAGRPAGHTDPLGRTTISTRDDRGRVARIALPDGVIRHLAYDGNDNLLQITHEPAGPVLDYSYDEADRLLTAAGIALAYNPAGDVVETTSEGIVFGASYTPARRLSGVTYDDQRFAVDYRYDPSTGQLVQVSDTLTGTVVDFFYDLDLRLVAIERNNDTRTDFSHDPGDNLVGIRVARSSTDEVLLEITSTHDALGNPVADTYTGPLLPGSALVEATHGFTFDAASQVASDGFGYDPRGRRVASPGATLVWDDFSRLSALSDIAFSYNGIDDVIERNDGTGPVRHHYNAALARRPLVAEQRVDGAFLRFYVFTPNGQPLYLIDAEDGNAVHHFDFDLTGSTRILTDESGNVSEAYDYLPFGQQIAQLGDHVQPYTFNGQFAARRLDAAGRFYRQGIRVYDAHTASFVSPEPLWPMLIDPRLLNPYQFAFQRPLTLADPGGRLPALHERLRERELGQRELARFFLYETSLLEPIIREGARGSNVDRLQRAARGDDVVLANLDPTPRRGKEVVITLPVENPWDAALENMELVDPTPDPEKPDLPTQEPVPAQTGPQLPASSRASCNYLLDGLFLQLEIAGADLQVASALVLEQLQAILAGDPGRSARPAQGPPPEARSPSLVKPPLLTLEDPTEDQLRRWLFDDPENLGDGNCVL